MRRVDALSSSHLPGAETSLHTRQPVSCACHVNGAVQRASAMTAATLSTGRYLDFPLVAVKYLART